MLSSYITEVLAPVEIQTHRLNRDRRCLLLM